MKADFSGYATKAGLKCADGRTIMPDAFKHQDQARVPLVWQHGHSDPENVLGHAILENRSDGVYAYGFFNKSVKGVHAAGLVDHRDITMLSIWANNLIERGGKVFHGAIREVSLVLSGANPGALIENVTIRHSDGDDQTLDDEVIIYTGLELEHGDDGDEDDDKKDDSKGDKGDEGDDGADGTDDIAARKLFNSMNDDQRLALTHMISGAVKHAAKDTTNGGNVTSDTGSETLLDVYQSMTDVQKDVLHFLLGQALESSNLQQDNLNDNSAGHGDTTDKDANQMTHNVFEKGKTEATVLSHDDLKGIVADAAKGGSLKDAVESYALAHGITDIDVLFPEAQTISNVPEFLARRNEWVNGLLSGTRKSPFTRIKTITADLTFEDARAKGYVKGTLKKEEYFGVTKRVTIPTTIYKKQKLDRDDMVDITDFDVVTWLKGEMRVMLDEELARAVLIGDGRDVSHEDKINEGNIRPIAKDHELYTTVVNVNIDDASSSATEIIDAIIKNRSQFRGTGQPTMYTTENVISMFLLLRDTVGRRIYKTMDELASELRVSAIVPVEVMEEETEIVAVLVNPIDYVLGADKGGSVSMFDDFDIDYNQYKYLIETRVSGALIKMKSAIVIKKVAGTDVVVVPAAPTFNETTGALTIVNTTGVVYKNGAGTVINAAGSPYTVVTGTPYVVNATPATGYYFSTSNDDSWTFTKPA
jgi:hypothetical protein